MGGPIPCPSTGRLGPSFVLVPRVMKNPFVSGEEDQVRMGSGGKGTIDHGGQDSERDQDTTLDG